MVLIYAMYRSTPPGLGISAGPFGSTSPPGVGSVQLCARRHTQLASRTAAKAARLVIREVLPTHTHTHACQKNGKKKHHKNRILVFNRPLGPTVRQKWRAGGGKGRGDTDSSDRDIRHGHTPVLGVRTPRLFPGDPTTPAPTRGGAGRAGRMGGSSHAADVRTDCVYRT